MPCFKKSAWRTHVRGRPSSYFLGNLILIRGFPMSFQTYSAFAVNFAGNEPKTFLHELVDSNYHAKELRLSF